MPYCPINSNNIFIRFWWPLTLTVVNHRLCSYPLFLSLEHLLPSSLDSQSRSRLSEGRDLNLSFPRLLLCPPRPTSQLPWDKWGGRRRPWLPVFSSSAQPSSTQTPAITTALAQACSIAYLQVGPRPPLRWPRNWLVQQPHYCTIPTDCSCNW